MASPPLGGQIKPVNSLGRWECEPQLEHGLTPLEHGLTLAAAGKGADGSMSGGQFPILVAEQDREEPAD